MQESDPAYVAAVADAWAKNCCANPGWRNRLCEYHQGFEDGYDQSLIDAVGDGDGRDG